MQPLNKGDYNTMPLRSANDVHGTSKYRKRPVQMFRTRLPEQYMNTATGSTFNTIENKSRWHWLEQGIPDARLPEDMYKAPVLVHGMPDVPNPFLRSRDARPIAMLTQPQYVQVFVNEPYRLPTGFTHSHQTTRF